MSVNSKLILTLCVATWLSAVRAQVFYLGESTGLYVGEELSFYIGGNLEANGTLENEGLLELYSDIDFVQNTEGGNITLMGDDDQNVIGQNLTAGLLTLRKSGEVHLQSNQLMAEALDLQSGIFNSDAEHQLYVSNGQSVTGGSSGAHVAGSLTMQSVSSEPLRFPMGIDGTYYEELFLKSAPAGTSINVIVRQPDADRLIPGDSLIGLADEVEWIISHDNSTPFTSVVGIVFEGLDLENYPHQNDIRADKYVTVLARLKNDTLLYSPTGYAELTDTDGVSFGTIVTESAIRITGDTTFLALGKKPAADGPYFYVPNAFAPDGDFDENRLFRPFLEGYDVYSLEIRVWNRFNQEVYRISADDPKLSELGWDGTHKGFDEPEGIYYFKISLESEVGSFSKNGTLLLLR